MYEAAAYSQNLFKVMVDPLTWILAAIAIFALRRHPLKYRIALALGVNVAWCLVFLVWPAGESGKPYAWKALMFEFFATSAWLAIFIGCRRLFGVERL